MRIVLKGTVIKDLVLKNFGYEDGAQECLIYLGGFFVGVVIIG